MQVPQLEMAARLTDGGGRALEVLIERCASGRLPLLSVLATRPLKLQPAHLSFQAWHSMRPHTGASPL